MSPLKIKPLSKEDIHDRGLSTQDLWILKLEDEIFGPFETQALKDYSYEHEFEFNDVQATKLNQNFWKPFYSYAVFERRGGGQPPEEATSQADLDHGPYWVLEGGHRSEPLSKQEILDRLTARTILATDLISTDEGQTWVKVYQIECFDRRRRGALPFAPQDASFQKARKEIAERMEVESHGEELADMAHLGQQKAKVLSIKVDEIPLEPVFHMSPAIKIGIPVVAGIVVIAFIIGNQIMMPPEEPSAELFTSFKPTPRQVILPDAPRAPSSVSPTRTEPEMAQAEELRHNRQPSSVPSIHRSRTPSRRRDRPGLVRNGFVDNADVPTRIETHEANDRAPSNDPYERDYERDKDLYNREMEPDRGYERDENPFEELGAGRDEPPREHSLVGQPEGGSLDDAMGRRNEEPPYPDTYIEEISDF